MTIIKRSILIAVVVAIAGCGNQTPKLTSSERLRVAEIELAFSTTVLNSGRYPQTLRGVDYLVSLCRRKRDAIYEVGSDRRTVKQVVEDGANELREYQPVLAAKLDRVLNDGCV